MAGIRLRLVALLLAPLHVACGGGGAQNQNSPSWVGTASGSVDLRHADGTVAHVALVDVLPYGFGGPVGCSRMDANWTLVDDATSPTWKIVFGADVRVGTPTGQYALTAGTPNNAEANPTPSTCLRPIMVSADFKSGPAATAGAQWASVTGTAQLAAAQYDPKLDVQVSVDLTFANAPEMPGAELHLLGTFAQSENEPNVFPHPFTPGPSCASEQQQAAGTCVP